MTIHIIDNYYIDTTDAINVQAYVDKGKDKKGNTIKVNLGYCRTFKEALECIYRNRQNTIGGDRVVELEEAMEILRANHADFKRLLEIGIEEV